LSGGPRLAPGCTVADWSNLLARPSNPTDPNKPGQPFRIFTEGTFADISPPHVIGLTISRDEAMVLDTELGVIHWQDCPSRIEWGENRRTHVERDLDDEVPEEEANWRRGATAWAIPDIFETPKDELRQLNWIPICHCTVRNVPDGDYHHEEGMMSMLQDIYREHGWPDLAVYRKSDCLEAVQKAMSERYPESSCCRG
jgi:hypothetical protein